MDFTAQALRRLAANVVDTFEDGVYRRVLRDREGVNVVQAEQADPRTISLRITGPRPQRWVPVVARMLGTEADVHEWYARVRPFPWLARLSRELRGLRPPRYPSLWEALAHAIVFQQISIHAAGSIMRRLVEALGEPVDIGGAAQYAFPLPEMLLRANDAQLRAAGLSANKASHLRHAALAVAQNQITDAAIEALSTPEAIQSLINVRGIGPWSAAVVLLRGFGRLDVFPLKDSGVARSMRMLSDGQTVDADALLEALGSVRGMLYFHLLLGRLHNLVPIVNER